MFPAADGRRLDRHGAGRTVRKTAPHIGNQQDRHPHTLRHAFITVSFDAGVPAARHAGGGLTRRSAHYDAALPGARQPGPVRHLYRRRQRRGRRPVNRADEYPSWRPKPPGGQLRIDRRPARGHPAARAHAFLRARISAALFSRAIYGMSSA